MSVVHASDAKVVAHLLGQDVLVVVSSAAVLIAIAMFEVGMGVTASLYIDVMGNARVKRKRC